MFFKFKPAWRQTGSILDVKFSKLELRQRRNRYSVVVRKLQLT